MNIAGQVESAIGQVEQLYRTVTGREAPDVSEAPYAAIPPEKDPQIHVEEQLDRLLQMLAPWSAASPQVPAWTPPIAVWESAEEVLICVDLPGVAREAVQLTVTRTSLEIVGERPAVGEKGGGQLTWVEPPAGPFRRAVPLPPGTVPEQLQAKMKNGVLQIHVPRALMSGSRTIPVA